MPPRPTELVLAARVARRYYLDDQSKSEIADDLGISRFRVARLLDAARRGGLVTIEVHAPDRLDPKLTDDLQRAYRLRHAIVLEDVADDDTVALRAALGTLTADVLREVVTGADVLGMAWARSLQGIATTAPRLPPCPVVQLTGALPGPDGSDVLELVRKVALASGGTPHVYYAPLVAPDTASARMVRRQPDVARAIEVARGVTVAVVGIGAWAPGLSTVYDSVEAEARDKAAAAGAIGEISGAFIDAEGRPVDCPLSRRIIGVTAEQLRAVDTVLSVAYGVGKAEAVAAALDSGLVNGLITHAALARALLDLRAEGRDDLLG